MDELISRYTHDFVVFYLVIVLITWLFNIVAVLLDLWTGLDKARALGEVIKSNKLRKTVNKISEYWRIQLFAFMIDLLLSLFCSVPYASIVAVLSIIVIEGWSVRENLQQKKSAAAKATDIAAIVLKAAAKKGINKDTLLECLEEIKKHES